MSDFGGKEHQSNLGFSVLCLANLDKRGEKGKKRQVNWFCWDSKLSPRAHTKRFMENKTTPTPTSFMLHIPRKLYISSS